ncbi:MAG: Lpg1974 family pore-forming outer membrane protein [Pirellulales bacterium]|nr:Lpg1974 family pore-forming outer membrane protein [Pirellulales bacterium]
MILASAMILGASNAGWSQGFEDDFAQEWVSLEDDETAIQLVGGLSSNGSGCDSCDGLGCDSCCGPEKCCKPWWAHRRGVMGQWLYLRPGNTDIIYTIEQNNTAPPNLGFPTGPVGFNAIDTSSGVRAGFTLPASDCTSLVVTFSHWEGDDQDRIIANGGNILVSEILHPSRQAVGVGAAGLDESATYGMDFQLVDVAYRHLWKRSDRYAINWKAGLKYGNMEQEFRFDQNNAVAVGLFSVESDIDFDGFGLMAGLDFERYSCNTGLSIYGSAVGSALAGEWNADYIDIPQLGGGQVANDYKDFRVTPLLELELGLAWQSKCGRARVNAGYMTSAWYDSLSSRAYIDAVRLGRYIDVGETITFSGLVLGGELRF